MAAVAREVMEYLADRDVPFEFTGKMAAAGPPAAEKPASARRASTGTVPDFAFTGEGVKVGSVIQGSVGEKAGLLAGDIITSVNGDPVKKLIKAAMI